MSEITKEVMARLNEAWFNVDFDNRSIINPFDILRTEDPDEFHKKITWLLMQPDYFHFICKHILNIELLPMQALILKEMWSRKFPMLVGSRGLGKTFLLSLYALLRGLLMPGRKIVIAGAAFRQSKFLHEYMENIWKNAPILKDLCDSNSGPRRDVDVCKFIVNNSIISCIPIGDGSKIRGLRANDIIADEFASVSREIFENVIAGFAAVSASPAENVRKLAAIQKAIELGIDPSILSDETQEIFSKSNQIILSGTAYYDFNHFAEYWKRWKTIIETRGDMRKIQNDVFNGEPPPASFDWTDYSVIRIPVDLVPKGFMDDGQIARSKATVHSGIFLMEFGACQSRDTQIITDKGLKQITEVQEGDLVLTHKGRFRPVIKKTHRPFKGKILKQRSYGYNRDVFSTPDHPYWNGEDFIPAEDVISNHLKNLEETHGIYEIYPEIILDDILETFDGKRLYPRGSKSNFNLEEQRDIRSSKESQSSIAKKYRVSQSSISYLKTCTNIPKNSIPKAIPLNYDFGCVVGYYAAEGNISKNGNAAEFSLDEHKDTKYQKHLLKCIYNVFGFHAKSYTKKDNTVVISINSRLVADILKNICPGKSDTKLIDHKMMFSNEDFMRGFVVGYWNGDGYIDRNKKYAKAHCINQSLLNQIRIALSYFDISCSLNDGSQGNDYHLDIRSNNFQDFMFEFYGEVFDSFRKSSITNNGNDAIFELKSVEYEDYDDFVYNLEVKEDHSYSLPNATVHNCFATDSQGFFKRSLIESCVGTDLKPVSLPSGEVYFDPVLMGNPNCKYVMGVDPASEVDNFSIVITEIHKDHRRVVYCWTTTRKKHVEEYKKGLTTVENFYSYCARKIRNLMKRFNICHIALDAQGGGISISEALHDSTQLESGEQLIWPTIDEDKEKPTDGESGLHILELCQFAKYDWYSEANHGMRKDFEDKALLLPRFDPVTIGLSIEQDKANNRIYDTLEDCVMELEELKNELCLIEISQTNSGRDRWDTPEVKIGVGKKERMRKDRYSSLLMANMASRIIHYTPDKSEYNIYGGFAANTNKKDSDKATFNGPAWFTNSMDGIY